MIAKNIIPRAELAELLPDLFLTAFDKYEQFLKNPPEGEASKDFKAQQEAGKVAVGHLALILELYEQLGGGKTEEDGRRREAREQALAEAAEELAGHPEKPTDFD